MLRHASIRHDRAPAAVVLGACCLALVLAAAVSCGRSTLRHQSTGSTGYAGHTPSTSAGGTSGGGGGTGGMGGTGDDGGGIGGAPQCTALQHVGEALRFADSDPYWHEVQPAIESSGDGRVAVGCGLVPIESPGPVPPPIVHSSFSPWGTWPGSCGDMYAAAEIGGQRFQLASSEPGSVALFLGTGSMPSDPPYGERAFAPELLAEHSYAPWPPSISVGSPTPGPPEFATGGAAAHLLGHQFEVGAYRWFELAWIAPGPAVVWSNGESGCATGRITADAVASGAGFVVALSSGRPFNTCYDDDGIPGPPDEVQIFRMELGLPPQQATTIEGTDPIRTIRLAPRPDGGAWVVWQEDGSSSFMPPAVQAMPVDQSGQAVSDIVTVVPSGVVESPFAVATLGTSLVVAWRDALTTEQPIVSLRLFDETGMGGAQAIVDYHGMPTGGRIDLLAGPGQDQLLVGVSVKPPGGEPRRVEVARFDCF